MKKIIFSILLFLQLFSFKGKSEILSLDNVYFNLCDSAGLLMVQKVLHLKPNDKVCLNVNGIDYRGLVTLREESERSFIKVIGKFDSQDNKESVGFGFYIDLNGKFIGTVINQTQNRKWSFEYSTDVNGYILIEDFQKSEKSFI